LLTNNILEQDKINEDTYIVLLDDDFIYKTYLLEYFDKNINQNKNMDVATYYSYSHCNITIGQSAVSMIFKYNIINIFLEYYEKYLFYHDDF